VYSLREEIPDLEAGDAAWGQALTFLGIGPWMLLQLLIVQNVARTAAYTGWDLPSTAALLIAGNVLGLAGIQVIFKTGIRIGLAGPVLGAISVIGYALMIPEPSIFNGIWQLLMIVVSPALLAALVTSLTGKDKQTGLLRITIMNGIGSLLFVLLTFLYYVSYDIPIGFKSGAIPIVAVVIIVLPTILGTNRSLALEGNFEDLRVFPNTSVLFLVVILFMRFNLSPLETVPADPPGEITIMAYNIHGAFDTAGQMNLEAIAQVIEAADADLVGFQEVSRGYLTGGSVDMLLWLSNRLGMPYVTGPTADPQWGNAVLSRYPITSSSTSPLPPDDLLLLRGFITTSVDLGTGTLQVLTTHYHHRGPYSEIRQVQSPPILSAWDGAPASIILGDLNAVPSDPEMEMFAAQGLVQAASIEPGDHFTYPSFAAEKKIDYIWATPELLLSDYEIPQTTASDHLPLVVTVQLP
jgi:endonuclease/exonuclease/phosphatase family metal-dependent hydrolase